MKKLVTSLSLAAVAVPLSIVALPTAAHAGDSHARCNGSAVRYCVVLNTTQHKVAAQARIDDKSSDGRYWVATQDTRVEYFGLDNKWHLYAYPNGDYDGWKGNYDYSVVPWRSVGCGKLRAKSTFTWKSAGGGTHTTSLTTFSHTFC